MIDSIEKTLTQWVSKIDSDVLLQQHVIPWLVKIGTALAIVLIGRWIASRLTQLLRGIMLRANIDGMLVQFLCTIANVVILSVVALAALDHLGVPTSSMLAVLGAAGLAVGLALRDSLSNFAAGIMLIIFRPFRIGDYIDGGGVSGTVESVRIFSTILLTADSRRVVIPNGQIANAPITNYSNVATRRIDLVFGIGYNDDIRHARHVINKLINADVRILKDPAPMIVVGALGESSVDLFVRPWVKTADYWAVNFDLTEKIKLAFDEEGISFPFPQRDVHVLQHNNGQTPPTSADV